MSDAAVDFDAITQAQLPAEAGEVTNALDRTRQEFLAAEARVHAHDQDVVDHRQDLEDHFNGRRRVQNNCGLDAVVGNELQGAVEVAASFDVDADHVRAGLGEGRDELVGVLDHQMAVEREPGDRADRLDHRRAEGDVGHKVSVHHVDVDNGASAALGRGDFVGEVREVGREDGEG